MIKVIKHNFFKFLLFVIFSLIFLCEVTILLNINKFEWPYIYWLLGLKGVIVLSILNLGIILYSGKYIASLVWRTQYFSIIEKIIIGLAVLLVLFISDWLLIEENLTFRLFRLFANSRDVSIITHNNEKFDNFDLQNPAIKLMHDRIVVNRPDAYEHLNIIDIIKEYSNRYATDPVFLFYWLYLGSFYGEAPSGPLPFCANMTAETFRDFIQAHLPPLFVESPLRIFLIETRLLGSPWNGNQRELLREMSLKIRYLFHKATYDISVEPYDCNILSDTLRIFQEYHSDILPYLDVERPLDKIILESFYKLRNNCLLTPYEQAYIYPKLSGEYYKEHGDDIIAFSRAIFYKTLMDFRFATLVQALVVKYNYDFFDTHLPPNQWAAFSNIEKYLLIAMVRDVYIPNIGRPSYNLYCLPELNCAPLDFIISSCSLQYKPKIADDIWLPEDMWKLWGSNGLKKMVFREVWQHAYGIHIRGIPEIDTLSLAYDVVWYHTFIQNFIHPETPYKKAIGA